MHPGICSSRLSDTTCLADNQMPGCVFPQHQTGTYPPGSHGATCCEQPQHHSPGAEVSSPVLWPWFGPFWGLGWASPVGNLAFQDQFVCGLALRWASPAAQTWVLVQAVARKVHGGSAGGCSPVCAPGSPLQELAPICCPLFSFSAAAGKTRNKQMWNKAFQEPCASSESPKVRVTSAAETPCPQCGQRAGAVSIPPSCPVGIFVKKNKTKKDL